MSRISRSENKNNKNRSKDATGPRAGSGTRFSTDRRGSDSKGWFSDVDWMVIGVLLFIIFAGIFLFNLFRSNRPADVADALINSNIEYVKSMSGANADDIEAAVSELDQKDEDAKFEGESEHAMYMRKLENVVIIGDSVTAGLTVYGWLSEGQVFSEIGASVVSSDDKFSKASQLHPKYAFFAFGMNDMGNFSGSAPAFINVYSQKLDDFKKESPDTDMFICSITIPNDYAISNNGVLANYKDFNKALQQMCKEKGYTFVDSVFILREHPELYAGDGIHVSTDYYPLWMNNMIKSINAREQEKARAKREAEQAAAKAEREAKEKEAAKDKESKDKEKDNGQKQDGSQESNQEQNNSQNNSQG